jgi:hypothetical protein
LRNGRSHCFILDIAGNNGRSDLIPESRFTTQWQTPRNTTPYRSRSFFRTQIARKLK